MNDLIINIPLGGIESHPRLKELKQAHNLVALLEDIRTKVLYVKQNLNNHKSIFNIYDELLRNTVYKDTGFIYDILLWDTEKLYEYIRIVEATDV